MLLNMKNLDFRYQNQGETRKIFDGASAQFSAGHFYALMGPSGSGKTTLFRLLTRELEPTDGSISIAERQLTQIPVRELRSEVVGRIFQDYMLVPFLNPIDNLLLAREITAGKTEKEDRVRAQELLARVGLAGRGDQAVASLSGGEQQRVAIARALIGDARILLADEPTGALDRENTQQIAQLLASLAQDEEMIVIAGTHDPAFARYTDSVVRISNYGLAME